MKNKEKVFGIVGLVVFLFGLMLAFIGYVPWYVYFVTGGAVFLAYVNYRRGNKTLFWLFKKEKAKFFKIYILYTLATVFIELSGRLYFNFWHYNFDSLVWEFINVFLLTYQFAFFFVYEFIVLVRHKIKNKVIIFPFVVFFFALLNEIPNTFAWEWVYAIPYLTYEILDINIVVIAGWSVLIATPLIVKKLV